MQGAERAVLDKLTALASQNADIGCLWLYGSRARKTANVGSDYDLAVLFSSHLDEPLERRLRPETLAIDWAHVFEREVSVIDIDQAPLPLAFTVLLDNHPIYVADYRAKLAMENKLMSRWEHDGERYRHDKQALEIYPHSVDAKQQDIGNALEQLARVAETRELNEIEGYSAERLLQVLIESCIGVAKH